ncbi:glycosyltransferase family 92 protein [Ekhidna sp.]|uniref:glycosyltransferase family 92 protein n=1 Tax=Ekhidna sp. TaxID=2608089 RepID=UPI003CCBEF9E
MNFLTVAGIFKNESHVIKEWVEHYLKEGANHFLLIDNGSTDDYEKEISDYIEKGLITIIYDDTKWAQIELYNKYFPSLKGQSKWVLICDLDEFVYARRGYKTIASFLKDLPEKVGVVRIPWKNFGSNGHIKQPDSLISSFVKRAKQDGVKKPWMPNKKVTQSKVIIKPENVERYHIHFCYLNGKCSVITADGKRLRYKRDNEKKHFQPINEKILDKSFLHLNHYALQSKEWFLNVKCKRGAADTKAHDEIRNLSYFEEYDNASNDIMDNELAKKHQYL